MNKNINELINEKTKITHNKYLNIKNYWNKNEIEKIIQNFPTKEIFNKMDSEINSENRQNIRINQILNKNNNFHESIFKFFNIHSQKDFFHHMIDVFKLDPDLKNKSFGIHEIDKDADILAKINLCVNYPKKESVRGIHLDKENSILFGLLYLRKDIDKSKGANLDIFKFKNNDIKQKYIRECKNNIKNFNKIMLNKLEHKDLIKLDTINYEKNNMIWIKNSWDAIHSVTPRENPIENRIFINIVYMHNPNKFKNNNKSYKLE